LEWIGVTLLYYWRPDNYRRDLDMGAGFHLNQGNPLLHEIPLGDSLWAFTRRENGTYALAAELVIRAKTINPPGFRYGRYRVWGDLATSRYFRVAGQPNVEDVIRSLSCKAQAKLLAHAFQGKAAVRPLTSEDHAILCAAAAGLPLEARARIFPEEKLEAELLLGSPEAIERLLGKDETGMAARRIRYLLQEQPARDRENVEALQSMYDGRCQVCGWNPRERYQKGLCQGHHLHWVSRGGPDTIENMALLCPSHHVAVHRCDAPFDYAGLTFVFPHHREPLQYNQHLQLSA
jgi:5-methylcytosine-specific restriction protein A